MNYKYCSCFGHLKIDITEELEKNTEKLFESLVVNENVGNFFFGGFGLFDDLCWQVVTKLKQKYPHIKRIFCLHDPRLQRIDKRIKYFNEEDYEEFIYLDLSFDYWYTRIYYRNCEMINQSDFVVFYIRNTNNSGAYKAYKYAVKQKKQIFEL